MGENIKSNGTEIDLATLLKLIYKNKILISLIIIVIVLFAAAFAFYKTKDYYYETSMDIIQYPILNTSLQNNFVSSNDDSDDNYQDSMSIQKDLNKELKDVDLRYIMNKEDFKKRIIKDVDFVNYYTKLNKINYNESQLEKRIINWLGNFKVKEDKIDSGNGIIMCDASKFGAYKLYTLSVKLPENNKEIAEKILESYFVNLNNEVNTIYSNALNRALEEVDKLLNNIDQEIMRQNENLLKEKNPISKNITNKLIKALEISYTSLSLQKISLKNDFDKKLDMLKIYRSPTFNETPINAVNFKIIIIIGLFLGVFIGIFVVLLKEWYFK